MYFRYFGLARSPFEDASRFPPFYINDSYREAFVALRYGIELRLGLVVMTGESGVGKSSLVTIFRDSAKKNVRLAVLSARSERPASLLFRIVAGLGLGVPADLRAGEQTLKKSLLEQSKAGQIVAIIIDDAEELTPEDLAVLKRLLSLRSDGRHLMQIVLVGSPALASPNFPGLKSLRQRVRVWSQIRPLASHEVEAYIEHKLSSAGSVLRGLFQPRAMARIAAYSLGIPKTIDALCDRALRLAYLRSRDTITERIVEDAWTALQTGSEPETQARLSSRELHSQSSSDAHAEAPKPWSETTIEKISSGQTQSPAAGPATAQAAALSWIPRLSQRLTSLVLSRPGREHGRRPLVQRSYLAVGAAVVAALAAAAVISRPGSDRPPQTELVQESNMITESPPAPSVAVDEDSALQTVPVDTHASALDDTGQPTDNPPSPIEKRTVEGRGELVYLHTSQPEDFRALEDIGAVLRSDGYVVRDPRFTRNSTQGDVRFFFAGDRRAAERVKTVVEKQLQTRGHARRLQLLQRDGRKFRFAAPGKIEVWLPPLTPANGGSDRAM